MDIIIVPVINLGLVAIISGSIDLKKIKARLCINRVQGLILQV